MRWKRWVGMALVGACLARILQAAEPLSTPAGFDAAFAVLTASKGREPEPARLRQLFDLQWRYAMVESPEAATYNGYPGQSRRWTDYSREAVDRRKRELRRPLQVLETIDRSALGADDQLYLDLFRRSLEIDQAGVDFPSELLLLNQLDGPQQDLAQYLALMPTGRIADYEDRVARLEAIPRLLAQVTERLREGLEKGVVPARVPLRDVPRQLAAMVPEDPAQSPLYRSFADLPATLPAGDRERVARQALEVLKQSVYPAFEKFRKFVMEEYLPRCRTEVACASLPDGARWYAYLARRSTTTAMSPDEIHELGRREVARIGARMDAIMREVGFTGGRPAFFEFLRTDPRFFYDTAAGLLGGYRDIAKRADAELPRLFGRLPRLPYGVMPVPTYSEQSRTTAYYQPGSLSAGRPGNFYANTYNLRMRPKWEMEALTLHEAVPGHHLQIALAQEIEGAPEFQRHSETTAFVEGWGLYSESLGPAMGFYQDPYSRFGQLTYEMWRAIRLVVDTGMHAKGWTREQAIEFFKANAGKAEHDIVVEIDRYIVWPGQALAYKVGELKIQELRAFAERELGARFDVRAFHDELLGRGALPLDIVEPRMRAWVARVKAAGN